MAESKSSARSLASLAPAFAKRLLNFKNTPNQGNDMGVAVFARAAGPHSLRSKSISFQVAALQA